MYVGDLQFACGSLILEENKCEIVVVFYFYFRSVTRSLNKWEKISYCLFTKWLSFSVCGHCDRIFKWHLTLDGLRMAWKRESVDFRRERENIIHLYKRPACIPELAY